MSHYQRLATMFIRFVAFFSIAASALGILAVLYSAVAGIASKERPVVFAYATSYLVAGLLIYRLSARIGKRIGRGLDE